MSLDLSLFTIEADLVSLIEMREESAATLREARASDLNPDVSAEVVRLAEELAVIENQIREYIAAEIKKADGIGDICLMLDRLAGPPKERKGEKIICELDRELQRITERRDMLRARLEHIESVVQFVMEGLEFQPGKPRKIEGVRHTLYLKGNGGKQAVEISDESLVPDEFVTVTITKTVAEWLDMHVAPGGPRVPSLSLIGEELQKACEKCNGVGAPWNNSASVPCDSCLGTGKRSVPGARLAAKGQHVEVR